jgi:hypothetical protein
MTAEYPLACQLGALEISGGPSLVHALTASS